MIISVLRKPRFSHTFSVFRQYQNYRKCMKNWDFEWVEANCALKLSIFGYFAFFLELTFIKSWRIVSDGDGFYDPTLFKTTRFSGGDKWSQTRPPQQETSTRHMYIPRSWNPQHETRRVETRYMCDGSSRSVTIFQPPFTTFKSWKFSIYLHHQTTRKSGRLPVFPLTSHHCPFLFKSTTRLPVAGSTWTLY